MQTKYKAYPEYKESGVEWLAEIPVSWNVLPIKMLSEIFNGATPKSGVSSFWNGDISWVTPADLGKTSSPYIFEGARSITKKGYESCGTSLIPRNSIILSSRAPIGTLGIASNNLCTNQGCKSLVVKTIFAPKFLYYVLLSSTKQLNLLGRGTTFLEISSDELGSYKVGMPSDEEQQKIAYFLDHETAKIDTLIEKQKQLIKLLTEKRKAAISRAVTRGLNPKITTRDSGIDWLGKVPVHWNITKAKYLFEEKNRPVRDSDGIVTVFRDGQVCLRTRRRNSGFTIAILEHGYQSIRKGDLVIHSMDAFAGAIGVSEDNGRATPEYVVTTPYDTEMNCEYYADILRLMAERDYIFVLCPSVRERAPRFRFSKFQQVLLPVPPNDEQDEIENYLTEITVKYIGLIKKAELQIELLEERRTALISAAVTGKIDVRNWIVPESSNNKAAVA